MSRHETIIQYCKTLLLLAILCFAVWNISGRPVNAQLAAANGFNYSHITTNTNTLVKSSNGTFHAMTINTTAASAITIYDSSAANCSGGTTIATFAASATIGTYNYDLQFTNGLCVTTAGSPDITIMSR